MDGPKDEPTPVADKYSDWGIPGVRWRTYLSIFSSLSWLAFVALWVLLYGNEYTTYQNIAVVIISLVVLVVVVGLSWMTWAWKHDEHKMRSIGIGGMRHRISLSTVVLFGLVIVLIYWLFYYADGYNVCQNLGFILLLFVILAAIMTPVWMGWGMRYGHAAVDRARFEHEVKVNVATEVETAIEEAMEEIDHAIEEVERELEDKP
jgi:hypothetical protein